MLPEIVDRYVRAIDDGAPGLLTGFYLTGSIALGDYRAGRSDVDGVATLSRELTPADVTALRHVHEAVLPDAPHVDVVYLTADAFSSQPAARQRAPHSFEHSFRPDAPCAQLSPVTWAEVADYAVTVRGETPASLGITSDAAGLDAWVRGNLDSYWRGHGAEARVMVADIDGDMPLTFVEMLAWSVLGPPRLLYTITTGEITSKTVAGAWAAVRFPPYADLIDRCVRFRAGETVSATIADVRAAADLTDAVIDAALAVPPWRVGN